MKAQKYCTNVLLLLILISTRYPIEGGFWIDDGFADYFDAVTIPLFVAGVTTFIICTIISCLDEQSSTT